MDDIASLPFVEGKSSIRYNLKKCRDKRCVGSKMGRAKRLRDRVFGECPNCIYCGGVSAADTLDHMPPKVIFLGKDRPTGMEYSCCEACNSGGRKAEQAVAFFSRLHPPSQDTSELEILWDALKNNHPDLVDEIARGRELKGVDFSALGDEGKDLAAVEMGGPVTQAAFLAFSAKLAFALHYETTRRPVSGNGGAFVRWHTNLDELQGRIPKDLISVLGPPQTIKQGAKTVWTQFRFQSVVTRDEHATAHYAQFRKSFSISAVVADDLGIWSNLPDGRAGVLFRPGFLQVIGLPVE